MDRSNTHRQITNSKNLTIMQWKPAEGILPLHRIRGSAQKHINNVDGWDVPTRQMQSRGLVFASQLGRLPRLLGGVRPKPLPNGIPRLLPLRETTRSGVEARHRLAQVVQLIDVLGAGEGVISVGAGTETAVRIVCTASTSTSSSAAARILDTPTKVSIRAPTRHSDRTALAIALLSEEKRLMRSAGRRVESRSRNRAQRVQLGRSHANGNARYRR